MERTNPHNKSYKIPKGKDNNNIKGFERNFRETFKKDNMKMNGSGRRR